MLPEVVREGGCEEVHGVRVLHDEVSVAGGQQAGERPQGRPRPAGEGHQAAQLGRGQVLGAARRQGQHPGARVAPVWGEGGHHGNRDTVQLTETPVGEGDHEQHERLPVRGAGVRVDAEDGGQAPHQVPALGPQQLQHVALRHGLRGQLQQGAQQRHLDRKQ